MTAAPHETKGQTRQSRSVDWLADKLSNVDQSTLSELVAMHARFVSGRSGGMRLNIALCNAIGLNFSGFELSEAELRGARLSQSVFTGASLKRANLFGADLRLCDMRQCDLTSADLRGAILRGSNLERAMMQRADARNGTLMQRQTGGGLERLNEAADQGEGAASLRGVDLTGAKLSGEALQATDLSNAILRDSQLSGADLSGCILRGVQFEGADLTGANLSGSILHGAVLKGANLRDVNLDHADLNAAVFDETTFQYCDISKAILPKPLDHLTMPLRDLVQMHGAWILTSGREGMRADFAGFDLSSQVFEELELSAVDFGRALMVDTSFASSNLSMAQLNSSNCMQATFAHTRIRGTNFSYCVMNRADLRNADGRVMQIVGARDFPWPTNFTGAILDNAILAQAKLTMANFQDASLRYADLRGCDLRRANFAGADLTGVQFDGADTRGANFDGVRQARETHPA